MTTDDSFVASEHAEILVDLPWHANGTLAPLDAARVAAHVARCDDCRRELDALETMARSLRPDAVVERSPGPALARLTAKIDAFEARRERRQAVLSGTAAFFGRWRTLALPAAVALQAVVILVLVVRPTVPLVDAPDAPARYRTLTDAAPTDRVRPHMRLVFDDGATVAQMRTLLELIGAQVVAGPNASGALTVELAATSRADADRALAIARAGAGVVFAEVVGPQSPGRTAGVEER
jgi:Putative zinc-finger